MQTIPKPYLRLIMPALALSSLLHAQSTDNQQPAPADKPVVKPPVATATPASAVEDDEVIVLSPFVVSTDDNIGYLATSSLGGGRIKTDFRDIASQVQVMTPELLQDLNAFGLDDAYNYSTNVETGSELTGLSTSFFGGSGLGQGAANRSRGIGSSTTTRNFFPTSVPTNSYNTFDGGFTIASGPNAILFGLGNAGGISDSRGNSANLTRNKGQIVASADSFGTLRGSFDYNQVILKNKLAIRVDAMNSAKKFSLEPSYEDDQRLYGSIKFQPFRALTMEVFAETVDRLASRPAYLLPKDQVSAWFNPAIGNQTPYNSPDTGPANQVTLGYRDANGNLIPSNGYLNGWGVNEDRGPSYTFGSGISQPGTYIYRYTADVRAFGQLLKDGYAAPYNTTSTPPLPAVNPIQLRAATNDFNNLTLRDEQFYPFSELTPYGDTHPSEGKYKTLMSVNNLKITNKLFLEVAGFFEQNEVKDVNLFRNVEAALRVDPNAFRYNPGYVPGSPFLLPTSLLASASAAEKAADLTKRQLEQAQRIAANAAARQSDNPTRGKLYIEGVPQLITSRRSYKEFRASLAYEFDSRRYLSDGLAKWINNQRLFGNTSWSEVITRNQEQRRRVIDNGVDANGIGIAPGIITNPAAKDNGPLAPGAAARNYMQQNNRLFTTRQYIDPNDPAQRYGSFGGLDRYAPWVFDDHFGGTYTAAYVPEFRPSGRQTQDFSRAFSWQGYFLKNKLVLTYAKRWDTLKTKSNFDEPQNTRTGLYPTIDEFRWQRFEKPPTFKNDTKSIVVHPFSWVSGHYNESTNNAGSASTTHDMTGLFYPVATGKGKDYGLTFNAKGLTLRINKFKTDATSTDAGNQPIRDTTANFESRYINLKRAEHITNGLPAFDDYYLKSPSQEGYNPVDNTREYYRVFNNTNSKGTEIELTGRIGKFDLRATYATIDTIRDQVGPNFVAYATDPVVLARVSALQHYDEIGGARLPVIGYTNVVGGTTPVPNHTGIPIYGSLGDTPVTGWQNIVFANNNAKTILAEWVSTVLPTAANTQALNGLVAPKLRGKRANATVSYNLSSAWRFGLSARYRQEAVIAYYEKEITELNGSTFPTAIYASDISRPIFNDAEFYFDPFIRYTHKFDKGRKLTVQVNVINALGNDDIYVLNTLASDRNRLNLSEPQFSYYGWTDQTDLAYSAQVQEPRSYSLTVTLDF